MMDRSWLPAQCIADPCPYAKRLELGRDEPTKCPDCGTVMPTVKNGEKAAGPPPARRSLSQHTTDPVRHGPVER